MIKTIVDKIADRTRWGYLAAFIILLVSYIVSFVSTQKRHEAISIGESFQRCNSQPG